MRLASDVPLAAPFSDRFIGVLHENTLPTAQVLPVPPAAESALWAGKPHAAICAATEYDDIDAVYRRILDDNPKSGDVALFGEFLTAVLLGPNLDLLQNSPTTVDLRLVFEDPGLQRLPWEMMYGPQVVVSRPNAPLCARPTGRFAINREVPLRDAEPARSEPYVDFPLRVLFVAESKIDTVLRPGAEFLGLLRHLKIPANPQLRGDFVSAQIKLRFLPEADIERLQQECREFRPSVLHFICHGRLGPAGSASMIVLRKRADGAGEAGGRSEPFPVTADELADLLEEDDPTTQLPGWLPPVIVLNACYSATSAEETASIEDVHLPFAARLVHRGVAIALGMAGEVADPACQLFTLRFYQALLTGTSVVDAASQARRTVLTAWPAYQESIEWARPVLFIAKGLQGCIQLSPGPTFDLVTAAERFRKDGTVPAMMCDRYDMMVAYDRLVSLTAKPGAGKLLVAVSVEDSDTGLGKTRLLEEFAVRSILDMFVPCIVRKEGEVPRSFLDFALVLTDAINQTRRNFGLPPLVETESRLLAFYSLNVNPAAEQRDRTMMRLRNILKEMAPVEPALVLKAIQDDCARLISDIEAKTKLTHRTLILIDEFHRWDSVYPEVLENISFAGLGEDTCPIPVIMNYLSGTSDGQNIWQKVKSLPMERRPSLRRFESEVEISMVYRQLLLSQWSLAPKLSPKAGTTVNAIFKALQEKTRGVPLRFIALDVEAFIEGVRFSDAFTNADYETALRDFGV
ncbi:hypothetical protein HDF16_005678 [Granulicella aggregans]|uniref:CHAT domain-containing protein n=1 Tax=Granulicella aggregans TaxID=474949 RepID=A0A7W7ZJI8_9BACT|nr:hypothetical protein [Granulicella aggregans]